MKVVTPWPKRQMETPLRRRNWFGKRRLASQTNLDGPYVDRDASNPLRLEGDSYTYEDDWSGKERTRVVREHECNLVTSLLPNGEHAVTLDLDYDGQLLESRTEGHHHLYLDSRKSIPWKQYKKLLKVMRDCGLIEDGYYKASVARGFTALRKPEGYGITIDEPGVRVDFGDIEPF